MPSDPPTPPERIPDDVVEALTRQDPETLRAIADHADALAAHREDHVADRETDVARPDTDADPAPEARGTETDPPDGWNEDEWGAAVEDARAPPKATLTVKTINDNDYYYYQWREGDEVKSEYVAPVSPDG